MPKVLSPAPHVFLIFLVLFLELTPCSPFMLLPASRAGSLGFVCAGSASRDLDLRDLDLRDLDLWDLDLWDLDLWDLDLWDLDLRDLDLRDLDLWDLDLWDLDLRDLDLWDLPPIAGAVGSVQEVWLTIHCSGRPVCNRRRLGLTGSD